MSVLVASDVRKTYGHSPATVEALRGVSLEISSGEFIAIMGPSGSGKSTLLHLLGGLDVPTSGQIRVQGKDLVHCSDRERTLLRRRYLGFVFQAFNLVPTLRAVDNVMLPLLLDGVARPAARSRAEAKLKLVGLDGHDRRPHELSGGEKQRVAIARALAIEPALLLADEPTGSLDSANGQAVTQLLRSLVDEHGVTVAMVTHDSQVASVADRCVHLRDGRIDAAPQSTSPTSEASA